MKIKGALNKKTKNIKYTMDKNRDKQTKADRILKNK